MRTSSLLECKVIGLAGVGLTPFAAIALSDFWTDVVRVDRPGSPEIFSGPEREDLHSRGMKSLLLDLKQTSEGQTVRDLVEQADARIEGFRPGVPNVMNSDRCAAGPAVARLPKAGDIAALATVGRCAGCEKLCDESYYTSSLNQRRDSDGQLVPEQLSTIVESVIAPLAGVPSWLDVNIFPVGDPSLAGWLGRSTTLTSLRGVPGDFNPCTYDTQDGFAGHSAAHHPQMRVPEGPHNGDACSSRGSSRLMPSVDQVWPGKS